MRSCIGLGVLVASLASAIAATASAAPRIFVGRAPIARGSASAFGTLAEPRARATLRAFSPSIARLELARTDIATFGDGDTIVRFEQTHRGLPVVGRGAAVRLDARGESILAATSLVDEFPASIAPIVDAAAAARTAQAFSWVETRASDAHLVVFPSRARDEARLAWAVVPRVPFGLPTAPRVMVDAMSGDVLEARDMVRFTAQARVYPTNPIASPGLIDVTLPVDAESATLKNAFLESSNCIDKKAAKSVDFNNFPLTVHICDMDNIAVRQSSGDFDYAPAGDADPKDAFSEVSMFYHASRIYDFFRTLRGDMNAQVVVDKPLRTISNLQLAHGLMQGNVNAAADPNTPLDPFQNAFFSPAGGGLGQVFEQLYGFDAGAMWFGQGPRRDYSYDGDVIYHEFTHAVVDDTLRLGQWHLDAFGLTDAPGAMNEGLADYFSSALAGDPNVGEYASKDISPSLDVIRTLDNTDACPKSFVGEVHYDSTLFSGGLWSARASLADDAARAKFDAALYKAMMSHSGDGDLGYEDLTKLFLESLKADLPAGAAALETEMTKRGVLPACSRVVAYAGAPVTAPGGITSPGAFAAPGTASVGARDLAPGILQVSLELPANTASVTVTFTSRQQRGGGGGPGSQSSVFAPVVLAKFGAPIQWTTHGAPKSDATATVDATGDGKATQTFTATIDVPDGATSAYVQIANKGSQDGAYDAITVTSNAKPESEPAAPTGDSEPARGTASNPPGVATTTSTGCACRTTGGPRAPTGGIAVLALAALAIVRRRARAQR